MTLPFCFGTLAFVLMQDTVPSLHPVPLGEICTPEEHREAYQELMHPAPFDAGDIEKDGVVEAAQEAPPVGNKP